MKSLYFTNRFIMVSAWNTLFSYVSDVSSESTYPYCYCLWKIAISRYIEDCLISVQVVLNPIRLQLLTHLNSIFTFRSEICCLAESISINGEQRKDPQLVNMTQISLHKKHEHTNTHKWYLITFLQKIHNIEGWI